MEYPDQKEYKLGSEPTVRPAHIAYHGAMDPTADPRNQSCVVSESGAVRLCLVVTS